MTAIYWTLVAEPIHRFIIAEGKRIDLARSWTACVGEASLIEALSRCPVCGEPAVCDARLISETA